MSSDPSPDRGHPPRQRGSPHSPEPVKKLILDPEVAHQLELRRQLRKSNRDRTFDKSANTAKQLRDRLQAKDSEVLHSTLQSLSQDLAQQLSDHEEIIKQLHAEFQQRYILHKENVDQSFSEMQERHLETLTALVLYRNAEDIRADRRASSDVHLLERISVTLADRQEFDEAIAISKQAEFTHANDVEGRKLALAESCAKLERNLQGQFAKEVLLLDEKFVKGLQGIQEELDQEILSQQKLCSGTVQRLVLTAIQKANKKIGKKERETEIGNLVTKVARSKVQKWGMNQQFGFD
jgi:hypothetical protein